MSEQGRSTPLDELDDPQDYVLWYIKAFNILSSSRQNGMGIGRIPIDTIFRYEEKIGIIGTLEEFIYVIYEMDSVYIDYAEERIKSAKEAGNGK